MNFTPRQTDRAELLDLQRGSPAETRRSLRDLRRINTYLGGARVVCEPALRLLRERGLKDATLLDVGTGSADIPLRLAQNARREGIRLRVVALDNNARHLQIARAELADEDRVLPLQADAFRLPLPDGGIDGVLSSLFLHHFRPPQIVQLLREFDRVSRFGWVMNDLVRSYVPLIFFRLTTPIFARSYLTRHDGLASIRRAYTVAEMRHIVAAAGLPDVQVRGHFPYRLSITRRKP
jgi:ubiquinone/menaquinone biosynthesis C-methylase UbiE